ncbi:MAG: hypothetical protein U5M23_07400 [Marinagarivorans sp.]|nr:hypothetical protein [Marinagarivorans sp.]
MDPDLRFDKHMAASRPTLRDEVRRRALRLPDLFEGFNPLRYEDAQVREVEIGIDLLSTGLGFGRPDGPSSTGRSSLCG